MERPNSMNKEKYKLSNGDFDDVRYSIDIEEYCNHLESLQPTQFKVATEDSPEVLEKCCDNPNCRDTINYNKAPSISKPELNLNKAKDMLTRLVSQLGNEHVSEEYCEPLIEESQQLLSKLNKD